MNSSVIEINSSKDTPKHIAIIMDGNGRWAKEKGQDRIYGHYQGVLSVRSAVEGCIQANVAYLTLYAFSTENWNRPKQEVDALMELLVTTLNKEINDLHKNGVKLQVIGNFDSLPAKCQTQLQEAMQLTNQNTTLTLIIALSYSSKWEIVEATKAIATAVKNGTLLIENITEETISNYLCTKNIPDPELLIRTSGEHRISNFLLYQLAYAELYFTNTHWPDFRKEHLFEAIQNYQNRERRFGLTTEQIQTT